MLLLLATLLKAEKEVIFEALEVDAVDAEGAEDLVPDVEYREEVIARQMVFIVPHPLL